MEESSNTNQPRAFALFSTLGCHLCDEAKAILMPMFEHFNLPLDEVDIAQPPSYFSQSAEQLVEMYGEQIPVLYCYFHPQTLNWPFDEQAVLDYLKQVFADSEESE